LKFIYNFFIFLLYFLSINCSATEFKLNDYKCTNKTPTAYTLALLDKSMVSCEIEEDDRIPEAIRPFVHINTKSIKKRSIESKSFPAKDDLPEYFIVQMKCRKPILRSAFLTQALLSGEDSKRDEITLDESEEEEKEFLSSSESSIYENEDDDDISSSFSAEEEDELEYTASMLLFPVLNEPNKMLSYLLGTWPSLLNTSSIVPWFGLKIVASIGVASTLEDKNNELTSIKEVVTETHRQAKPIRGSGKQQKGLGAVRDFDIDPASDGLEKVRLKPVKNWGRALLDGDDFLKFHLATKGQKDFDNSQSMYEVAREAYKHYSESAIHKDFTPFLDEPVVGENKIKLDTLLKNNWKKYFDKDQLLYLHWSFWFRARGESDISSILTKIRKDPLITIVIGGQKYNPLQLIRSLPIQSGKDFYWFDRGSWYRILPTRFRAIRKRIDEITVEQEDLFLPDYEIDTTEQGDTQSKDYKELAYNKSIIETMKAQIGPGKPIAEAVLLDRENARLGGTGNQFEFSDIFMQLADKKYYLIHVKRENAREFDHHRTQAERCALFLGQNLDRWILPGLLITGILQDFYKKHINLPIKTSPDPKNPKNVKQTEQSWSSTFKDKFKDIRKEFLSSIESKTKKQKSNEFINMVYKKILNVNKGTRKLIKKIVEHTEIKSLIARFQPYEDALFRCFDAIEDLISYSKIISDSEKTSGSIESVNIEFIKGLFEQALAFLEKHPSLAKKHKGVLSQNARKNITIVQAIVKDGSESTKFNKQRLWGVDQTRKIIEKEGFNFKVVFIKDKTKIIKKRKRDSITIVETDVGDNTNRDIDIISEPGSKKMKLHDLSPTSQHVSSSLPIFAEVKLLKSENSALIDFSSTSKMEGIESTMDDV